MFYRNDYDLARESQEDVLNNYPQSEGNNDPIYDDNEELCPLCSRQHQMHHHNMYYPNMNYPNMYNYPNMFHIVHHHYHHHYDHRE